MLVRIRGNRNNRPEFTKNHFKQRLIFLERIIDNRIITFPNKNRMIQNLNDTESIISNKAYVLILNYSKKYQNNPDNFLIEEEVHTFNTYYGIIYKQPSVKLTINDLSLKSIIFIEDYNFNVIYNQLNRKSEFFENYNRYQSNSIFGSDMYRSTLDSIEEKIDAPHPKYYTLEEQKYSDESLETMKEMVLNNYNDRINAALVALTLDELVDPYTKIAHLNITMNSIDIVMDYETRDKLKKDIYYLVSSIKYDMEIWGISKIVGLMTSDKGFNFYQINTIIQMNPTLTQTCVSMFLECFQNRYDEIFKSMIYYLEGMHDLSIYFSLAPIENIIEISVQKFSKNKLEMIQQDIHDQLINTIF